MPQVAKRIIDFILSYFFQNVKIRSRASILFLSRLYMLPRYAVLRIRDVYPGSDFFHPGSRIRKVSIPDPGSSSKNFSILTSKKPKNGF
jgi:hypothetical protein